MQQRIVHLKTMIIKQTKQEAILVGLVVITAM